VTDSESAPPEATGHEPTGVSRRGLVGGLAIGAGIVTAGAIGGVAANAAGSSTGYRSERLVVDVACLADQWVEAVKWDKSSADDFRTPFLVEGWIYPEGTIKGDGFVPVEAGSIGRWFCRGFGVGTAGRGEPHVNTHQDYIFGVVGGDDPFPGDMISTAGIEGTVDRTVVAKRAIVGGTGQYLGATGQMFQQFIAWNTSTFPGSEDPGFSWRMTFDMRVLD
jgi:hypothetical protein